MIPLHYSIKNSFHKEIRDFINGSKNELVIICPYIKTQSLSIILKNCKIKKITIITSWKMRDLQLGISELCLYEYCKEKKLYLFLNSRIHLKSFIKDYSSCIFGSANITDKGLALNNNFNYELIGIINNLNCDVIKYFRSILNESILVNDDIYSRYKLELEKIEDIKIINEPDLSNSMADPEFLISALPMTKNVDLLFQIYSNKNHFNNNEDLQCAIHDILLYDIPENLEKDSFYEYLKNKFFKSKFIIKLLQFIGNEQYFGRVKEWIQRNCEDVPVPSRRDLTGNIRVLYKWIVDLSDGSYKIDIPRTHSERIYKVRNK